VIGIIARRHASAPASSSGVGVGSGSHSGALVGVRREQDGEQVDAGDAVDHAVMRLRDQRAAAALESLDHPQFPQRLPVVEALRHDARGEAFQLAFGARLRQRRVAHVVVDVEAVVVDPHRMALDRDPREPLAIARDPVQSRRDVCTHAIGVDAARRIAQRADLEDQRGADVLRIGVALEVQEGPIEDRKPLRGGHAASRSGSKASC
jgi:hypothetical protein